MSVIHVDGGPAAADRDAPSSDRFPLQYIDIDDAIGMMHDDAAELPQPKQVASVLQLCSFSAVSCRVAQPRLVVYVEVSHHQYSQSSSFVFFVLFSEAAYGVHFPTSRRPVPRAE